MKLIGFVSCLFFFFISEAVGFTEISECDTCHIKLLEYREPLEGLNELLLNNCEKFLSTTVEMVFVDLSDSIVIEYLTYKSDFGKKGYFLDVMNVIKTPTKKDCFQVKAHDSAQPNPCYFEMTIREESGELVIQRLVYTHTEI